MKYFDKDFFRFTLGFLIIVSLSLLIIAAVSAYAVGIFQIVFTSSEQSIKPDELSEEITIQTQDASGALLQTDETIDLEFVSTSGTGEFLGKTSKPAQKYMSKNTANRTFYYKDPTEGSFTITVNAKGRESSLEWSASQPITVSGNSVEIKETPPPTPPSVKKEEPKVEPKVESKKEEPKQVATPTPIVRPARTTESVQSGGEIPKEEKPKPKQVAATILAKEEPVKIKQVPTSTEVIIYEAPENKGWWSKFWGGLTNFLKNIFS